jgi:transcription antitermination factor NusG
MQVKLIEKKAAKEQIAENFKRLAIDSNKKVELKPSILKTQKTLDGYTLVLFTKIKLII